MKFSFFLAFIIFVFGACSQEQELSTPRQTFRQYVEAVNNKDIATIKTCLSRGSLKMLEESARTQNTTLDEALKNLANPAKDKMELPEMQDEKIEGDAATLKIKNSQTGTLDKVYFVHEDGRWKIALDKFMEEILKEVNKPD